MDTLKIYLLTMFGTKITFLNPLFMELAVPVIPQIETSVKKDITNKDGKVTFELDQFE